MADQNSPRCAIRRNLAKAAIDSMVAADVAKAAYDETAHQKDRNIAAAASALEAARAAQIQAEIAEIALRAHIEQHGCKS